MAPKKNEIFYFIQCNKEYLEKRIGKKNIKFSAMFQEPLVYKMFKNLSAEEKQKYTEMKNNRDGISEKKDCRGIPLSIVQKKLNEAKEKASSMANHVHATVDGLKKSNKLQNFPFYIICCSYYVKTDFDKYVPAEVSIIKCTLEDGITDYYTNIIKDELPLGEKYEAESYSSRTHHLLDKKYEEATTGAQVAVDVKNFILHNGVAQPIYTLESMMDDCEGVLGEIDDMIESQLRVYSLNQLLQEMYMVVDSPPATVNKHHCNTVLNNCSIDYHFDLPCKAHKELYDQGIKYCTLSMCKRWFYLMCADLNLEVNFNVIPQVHKHYAHAAEIIGAVTNIPSDLSIASQSGSVWDVEDDFRQLTRDFNDKLGTSINISSEMEFPTLGLSARKTEARPTLLQGVGRGVSFKKQE